MICIHLSFAAKIRVNSPSANTQFPIRALGAPFPPQKELTTEDTSCFAQGLRQDREDTEI